MVKKLSVIFAFTAPLMLFGQLINNFEVDAPFSPEDLISKIG